MSDSCTHSFFDRHVSTPTFVLTGDQDWAPDWALEATFDLMRAEGVPYHLFVTNHSGALSSRGDRSTLGVHPNFLPGSTHGDNDDAVLDTCQKMVPGANTFRTHAFAESTLILRKLVQRGFVADSNLLAFLQPGLVPIVHGAGLLRLPVFIEDDVFLDWAGPDLDIGGAVRYLFTPGLKIFNFHPALVGLNAPSVGYYHKVRPKFRDGRSSKSDRFEGRGVETVLRELIRAVKQAGHMFTSFPSVVATAYTDVPGDLYSWPSTRS